MSQCGNHQPTKNTHTQTNDNTRVSITLPGTKKTPKKTRHNEAYGTHAHEKKWNQCPIAVSYKTNKRRHVPPPPPSPKEDNSLLNLRLSEQFPRNKHIFHPNANNCCHHTLSREAGRWIGGRLFLNLTRDVHSKKKKVGRERKGGGRG